jgi:hypothetical protein
MPNQGGLLQNGYLLQWLFYFNLVFNSYENLKLDHVIIFQFELYNIHISNE